MTTKNPAWLDIDRSAPVVVRRERIIPADIERIWAVQTDIDRWTWRRWHVARMKAVREHCRGCGLVTGHASAFHGGLRFGHIRAAALGGGSGIENTTIV